MKDLVLQNCRLDGRYDIRERLGRGSYAEVFCADDTLAAASSPHKVVVVKALNVFLQNDLDPDLERTLVENFQNEALSLDRVRHPNIISRLGHGTAKDLRGTAFHYLVLEYLPGGDLAKYCRNGSLSLKEALSFLEQICAGLSKAHSQGIIHRDIKPQNLLLTGDHKIVKIADFGVARTTDSDSPITRVGTNIFAPPEHSPLLAGKTGSLEVAGITPAADIYSLAKTAYVLFTGESPRYLANQPITELPTAYRSRQWAVKLVEVLNKSTLDNPKLRYADVLDFWKSISELAEFDDSPDTFLKTQVSTRNSTVPQAHVALGFSAHVPETPVFDTAKNLKLREVLPTSRLPKNKVEHGGFKSSFQKPVILEKAKPPVVLPPTDPQVMIPVEAVRPMKRRRLVRILAGFTILFALFAGSLFATYNYILGRPLFGGFSLTSQRTGVASTDINLRSAPTTDNRPIGIVTSNSKVQIVRTSNNWHEVVIIQHGRPKSNSAFADRGWVYGDYIVEDK